LEICYASVTLSAYAGIAATEVPVPQAVTDLIVALKYWQCVSISRPSFATGKSAVAREFKQLL